MRLLHRLRHHVAQRNIEILAVMLAAAVPEHREDRRDRFLEHLPLVVHGDAERRQLGDRGAFAHAEFAAAVDSRSSTAMRSATRGGMVGGELEDAVAEPDVFGALAGGGEERFRRRRVRIFLQEMMLHHPGMVVAAAVGQFELRQRVLVELELVAGPHGRGNCSS